MNKLELEKKIQELGIDKRLYSLDNGNYLDNAINMSSSVNHYGDGKEYNEYCVYFLERGMRYEEKMFYSIEDACADFYNRLKKQKK